MTVVLKLGLAQALWLPRAYSLDDLLYYSANSGSGYELVPQVLTFISIVSGLYAAKVSSAFSGVFKTKYFLLWIFFLMYVFVQILSDTYNGGGVNLTKLMPIVLPFVFFSIDEEEFYLLLSALYFFLGLILFAGLFAAILNPDWAYIFDYETETAVFDKRFPGMLNHPNQLGALCVIVCVIFIGMKLSVVNILIFLSALISIILAQSKTSVVCLAIIMLFNFFENRRVFKVNFYIMSFCYLLFMFGWFFYMNLYKYLPVSEVTNLTGRTDIWEEAINIWNSNFIFGSGSGVWDIDRRRDTGLTGAANAHNQFLNTASMFGVLGVIFMGLYSFQLVKFSLGCGERKLIGSLLIYVFVRGFSESSMSSYGVDLIAIIVAAIVISRESIK